VGRKELNYIDEQTERRWGRIISKKLVNIPIEGVKKTIYIRVGKKKKRAYTVNVPPPEGTLQFTVIKTI